MSDAAPQLWTLDQLGAHAALALSADQPGLANGRVREIPDGRTIRYYTTIGLIDRPAQMRGRTALYGERHLLQLVAIKRLQAKGLPLAEIQQRLLGQSDTALRKLALLPASLASSVPAQDRPAAAERRTDFWAQRAGSVSDRSEPSAPLDWQTVSLDADILLLFEPLRSLDAEDIAALRTAAAPLLKLLHTRRLK